jgi:hypothetical protein
VVELRCVGLGVMWRGAGERAAQRALLAEACAGGHGALAGTGAGRTADALYLCILAYIRIIYTQVLFCLQISPSTTLSRLKSAKQSLND